jgi:hypothetical protein
MIPPFASSNQHLILDYTKRFNEIDSFDLDKLSNCKELQFFLPEAITFLTKNNGENQNHAQQVAHYLMGKIDYLPKNLQEPKKPISPDVKKILYDLIRTYRYFLPEAPGKTIEKFKDLMERAFKKEDGESNNDVVDLTENNDVVDLTENRDEVSCSEKKYCANDSDLDFLERNDEVYDLDKLDEKFPLKRRNITSQFLPATASNLESTKLPNKYYAKLLCTWVEEAPVGEKPNRQVTALVLEKAVSEDAKVLNLSNFNLTDMPPLPTNICELNLSGNYFTTLKGMPTKMPNLTKLDLANNRLTSLKFLPSEMEKLNGLKIDDNPLNLLVGLSDLLWKKSLVISALRTPKELGNTFAKHNRSNGATIIYCPS